MNQFVVFVFSLFTLQLISQVPIKNINQSDKGSNIQELFPTGRGMIFLSDHQLHIYLWQEEFVETVFTSSDDLPYTFLHSINQIEDYLFFTVFDNSTTLTSFIRFDLNTMESTVLISTINQYGNIAGANGVYSQVGDEVYFVRLNEGYQFELWKTRVNSGSGMWIDSLPDNSYPLNFTEYRGEVYFVLQEEEKGHVLWKENGEKATFFHASDPTESLISQLLPYKDHLYFTAKTREEGWTIWRTDGSPEGTELWMDLLPGSDTDAFIVLYRYKEALLFTASDPEHGVELWKTDGTRENTFSFTRYYSSGSDRISGVVPTDDYIYFTGRSEDQGLELWKSDATIEGTKLIRDINAGPAHTFFGPRGYLTEQGLLLFVARDSTHGAELWATNGLPSATNLLSDIYPGGEDSDIDNLVNFNGRTYFMADDLEHGLELWRTDGTTEGTELVANLTEGETQGRIMKMTKISESKAIFTGEGEISGKEPWVTDGSEEGTFLLADIRKGKLGSDPFEYIIFDGNAFFGAELNIRDRPLYRSDGSKEGTVPLGDIEVLQFIKPFNQHLYFTLSSSSDVGSELWRIDGSAESLELVKDIYEGRFGSMPGLLHSAIFKERFYFPADDGLNGVELWSTDGTAEGTEMLRDIYDEERGGIAFNIGNLTPLGEQMVFTARTVDHGSEPWVTDGTRFNTRLLADIREGGLSSSSQNFVAYKNRVYFTANDGDERGIYATDGDHRNGVELIAPYSQWGLKDVHQLRVHNGFLYFYGTTEENGRELWRSDGTVDGTSIIKDINPGPANGSPSYLLFDQENLIFSVTHPDYGKEMWMTDGTDEGTQLFLDLNPGVGSGNPSNLIRLDSVFIFSGTDGITGNELFRLQDNKSKMSDLSLKMNMTNSVRNNKEQLHIEVTVINEGPDDVDIVEIKNAIPPGFTRARKITGDGQLNNDTIRWRIYNIVNGDSSTVSYIANVDNTKKAYRSSVFTTTAEIVFSTNEDEDSSPNNDEGMHREDDEDALTWPLDAPIQFEVYHLNARVFLEGPYDLANSSMSTTLNELGLLPGQKPVTFLGTATGSGQPYFLSPWNYWGSEGADLNYQTTNSSNNAGYSPDVTDYVLVSIRSDVGEDSEVCRLAALLMKDGSVSFFENANSCLIDPNSSYYMGIEHRNHMPVLSARAEKVFDGYLSFDFTGGDSYRGIFGHGQKRMDDGTYAMYAGNIDQSNQFAASNLDLRDLDQFLRVLGQNSAYLLGDLNLDGDINTQDRSLHLKNNGVFSDVSIRY